MGKARLNYERLKLQMNGVKTSVKKHKTVYRKQKWLINSNRFKVINLINRNFDCVEIARKLNISYTRARFLYKNRIPEKYEGVYGMEGRDLTREKIRKRDDYTCQLCGKLWTPGMRKFDVHHKDLDKTKTLKYEKYNKEYKNMITLCHKCHFKHHKLSTAKD